jgi:glycosyltransferase involved in cell wall biosynthesis
MERINVAFAGDDLSKTTGLSYVISELMERFYDTGRYDISYICLTGEDVTSDKLIAQGESFSQKLSGMKIYNTQLNPDKVMEFDKAINDIKPEVIISFHDPWVLDQIAYSSMRETYVWIAYLPIEAPEYPETVMYPHRILSVPRISIKEIIGKADAIVPCSPMGKETLTKMGLSPTDHVYLGVDKQYLPKSTISKSIAFDNKIDDSNFLFMTMGMNHERKRIDKVIESFHAFLSKVGSTKSDKYKLYIHTDVNSRVGGTDLNTMTISLGLQGHVLKPAGFKAGIGISQEKLHDRYNACDCYIGLPSGEGFGMGMANAMMHGKPIIYIDYGGHVGYCADAGLPVRVKDYVYAKNGYIKLAIADTNDAAKRMARIVSDNKLRNKLSNNASEIARKELYWDVVFPKFRGIVEKTMADSTTTISRQFGFRRIV